MLLSSNVNPLINLLSPSYVSVCDPRQLGFLLIILGGRGEGGGRLYQAQNAKNRQHGCGSVSPFIQTLHNVCICPAIWLHDPDPQSP